MACMAREKRAARALATIRSLAGGFAPLTGGLVEDGRRDGRVLLFDGVCRERCAAVIFLTHGDQRLAELEHAIGTACGFGIFLDDFGKSEPGLCVVILVIRDN